MNRNLPRVYANPINKKFNNNKEVYSSSSKEKEVIKMDNIPKKINEIFANPHHVYKSKVRIGIDSRVIEKIVVGKTNKELLMLDGSKIDIKKIDFIERI